MQKGDGGAFPFLSIFDNFQENKRSTVFLVHYINLLAYGCRDERPEEAPLLSSWSCVMTHFRRQKFLSILIHE